jgi:hypothetical protein
VRPAGGVERSARHRKVEWVVLGGLLEAGEGLKPREVLEACTILEAGEAVAALTGVEGEALLLGELPARDTGGHESGRRSRACDWNPRHERRERAPAEERLLTPCLDNKRTCTPEDECEFLGVCYPTRATSL